MTVVSRDSALKISGEDPERVSCVPSVRTVESLMTLAARGEAINEQNVRYVIQLVRGRAVRPRFTSWPAMCCASLPRASLSRPRPWGRKSMWRLSGTMW